MEKAKIYIMIALVLALFFYGSMDAEASASDTLPSYYSENITQQLYDSVVKYYKFVIGTDGIFVNDVNVDYTNDSESYSYVSYSSGNVEFDFDTGALITVPFTIDNWASFDYLFATIYGHFNGYFTYTDYGLSTFTNPVFTIKPYLIFNNEKIYLTSGIQSRLFSSPSTYYNIVYIGFEVECVCSYDASISLDSLKTMFANTQITLTTDSNNIYIGGLRYASTGDMIIADSVVTQGNAITNALTEFKNLLIGYVDDIETKLEAFRIESAAQLNTITLKIIDIFNRLDLGFEELNFGISEFKKSVDERLVNIIELISRGYASADRYQSEQKVDYVLSQYDESEASIRTGSQDAMNEFTVPSDGFNSYTPQFVSALSLVSTMMQSVYASSGDFGVVLSVIFTITIASMVIGLFRFYKE